MSKKYYAVKTGRTTGVFQTWAECEVQVKGFSGAEYKFFSTLEEASDYAGQLTEKDFQIDTDGNPILAHHNVSETNTLIAWKGNQSPNNFYKVSLLSPVSSASRR